MFTVSIETNFLASHSLTQPDGSKEPMHEHNWAVIADVSSDELNNAGLVIDFRQLKQMLDSIVAELGNTPLDKSAEKIAKYIYEKLRIKLPKAIILNHIKVVEQPGRSAKFSKCT